MAHIQLKAPDLELDEPTMLDGLPGEGLIGKLVADYVVDQFDMVYYAGVYCEGIPRVAAYRMDDSEVRPPLQIHADADNDLLVLASDVPISPSQSPEFNVCITDWLDEVGAVPIYLSGLPAGVEGEAAGPGTETDSGGGADSRGPRELSGLATGDGDALLAKADLPPPRHDGIVTGPTGALLNRACDVGLDSVGLLVESHDELPDYEAARTVIERGIEPIVGIDVDTGPFVDRSIEMSPVAESVLQQLEGSPDGSSRAQPTATFH